ncbi:DUF1120 domain-containing protein [Dyella sp. Tek66A03]|uniref:DUF1120 domain-containing protein n=1 Tax=Dyella sp. Tek66A03 TaxID=3458298 RepID=UPI00403EA768
MNIIKAALATALLGGVTGVAFAGSTADISVTGTITPGSCSIDISNGGRFDLGTIPVSSLNADRSTQLSQAANSISVTCDAPVRFALRPVDNRADSSSGGGGFGLGVTPSNEKIGSYNLAIVDATIDGNSEWSVLSNDGGTTWNKGFSSNLPAIWSPSVLLGYTVAPDSSASGPTAIQNLSGDLTILTPRIVATSNLTLTDEVPLDGSATIELVYL